MGKGMKRLIHYCTCKVRGHLLEPVLIVWTCLNPGGLSWQSAMLLLHEAHVAQTHSSHLALACCLPFVSVFATKLSCNPTEQFATKISELYRPLPMALNDCCGCFYCLRPTRWRWMSWFMVRPCLLVSNLDVGRWPWVCWVTWVARPESGGMEMRS